MDQDDFLRNITRPEVAAEHHHRQLKMTLLSTRKTAALSVWLVAVPCFFLFCVLMKSYFKVNAHVMDTFSELFVSIDQSPQGWWLNPVLFFALPLLTIGLNLLAILHISYEQVGTGYQVKRRVLISIQLNVWNLVLIGISSLVILIVMSYLFVENYQPR